MQNNWFLVYITTILKNPKESKNQEENHRFFASSFARNSNISPCKNTPNLQKKSSEKKPKSFNNSSITNLEFPTQAKNIIFNPHIKIDLLLLLLLSPRGPIKKIPSKSTIILYNESKHKIPSLPYLFKHNK